MNQNEETLYVLGTGNATVRHCYNTCFAIRRGSEYLLVDTGGGNGILTVLDDMNIPLTQIHSIILTHKHSDHLLGIVWVVRMIADAINKETYSGQLHIYGHSELMETVRTFCALTLAKKHLRHLDSRIVLHPVSDGETRTLGSFFVTFFDIHSTKDLQYGFILMLENGRKLCCTGDEPYNPLCRPFAEGSEWLLHEAFCLYAQRDLFHPYEKHHSTVREACLLAEELHIPNLVLWHTEEKNLTHRKELYTAEGSAFYNGRLFVPDDRERIRLS